MIKIHKKDNTFLKIVCERSVSQHLSDYFSFYAENYFFNPLYKQKLWDGRIKLWKYKSNEIYIGLFEKILKFFKEFDYEVSHIDKELFDNKKLDYQNNLTYYNQNQAPIQIRDYQLDATKHLINNPRSLLLSPTASGKSLILYSTIRHYQNTFKEKILIIVPTTNLVNQLYTDFDEYSYKDEWNTEKYCHQITAGKDKNTNKKIIISTWQSLFRQPKSYFDQFKMLLVDEVHLATAKGLTSIAEKTTKCQIKIGVTGTLKESKCHKIFLEGLFGPVYNVISTNKLMDLKHISKLEIKCLLLNYCQETKKLFKKTKYQDEIKFLINNKKRNNFIKNLAIEESKTKNCLILFNLKKHGQEIFELLKNNKNVFLIYGKTNTEEREMIRKYTSKNTKVILIASYGVFSTGANIPNLQSLIFAHPYKSEIKNLQSIGRVLRLDDIKNKATLFDIADDLSWKSRENYSLKHWKNRIKIYNKQKFSYDIYSIPINSNLPEKTNK